MDEEIFNFEELNLTASSLQEIGLLKSEEEKEKTTDEELETKSEEEKEKENNKTDEDKSKSPSSEDDSSTFSVFANVLKEEGVFNLPDEDLAAMLKEKGFPIARRTIAKYREQLDIPVARLRKKM